MTADNFDQKADGELIAIYVRCQNQANAAMKALRHRYEKTLRSRFLAKVSNEAKVDDLLQDLWVKVSRSLVRYKHEGKFANYLSTIGSNLLKDFYKKEGLENGIIVRAQGSGPVGDSEHSRDYIDAGNYQDPAQNVEQQVSTDALMQHLICVLVPALPVEQRAAWLIRHESEYWEPGQPLEWNHLAEMNGLTETETAGIFNSARNKLMIRSTSNRKQVQPLEEIELLIFLVWTQAQRLDKSLKFTWDDIAELLGQPAATMRTRYRSAQKALSQGIRAYNQD